MPKMIDGDALIENLGCPEDDRDRVINHIINNAPTVDPVRHARWARKDNSKNCKRVGDFEEWYECSACEGNAGDKSADQEYAEYVNGRKRRGK